MFWFHVIWLIQYPRTRSVLLQGFACLIIFLQFSLHLPDHLKTANFSSIEILLFRYKLFAHLDPLQLKLPVYVHSASKFRSFLDAGGTYPSACVTGEVLKFALDSIG